MGSGEIPEPTFGSFLRWLSV